MKLTLALINNYVSAVYTDKYLRIFNGALSAKQVK